MNEVLKPSVGTYNSMFTPKRVPVESSQHSATAPEPANSKAARVRGVLGYDDSVRPAAPCQCHGRHRAWPRAAGSATRRRAPRLRRTAAKRSPLPLVAEVNTHIAAVVVVRRHDTADHSDDRGGRATRHAWVAGAVPLAAVAHLHRAGDGAAGFTFRLLTGCTFSKLLIHDTRARIAWFVCKEAHCSVHEPIQVLISNQHGIYIAPARRGEV